MCLNNKDCYDEPTRPAFKTHVCSEDVLSLQRIISKPYYWVWMRLCGLERPANLIQPPRRAQATLSQFFLLKCLKKHKNRKSVQSVKRAILSPYGDLWVLTADIWIAQSESFFDYKSKATSSIALILRRKNKDSPIKNEEQKISKVFPLKDN